MKSDYNKKPSEALLARPLPAVLFYLALISAIHLPAQATAVQFDGFEDIKWGASVSEVSSEVGKKYTLVRSTDLDNYPTVIFSYAGYAYKGLPTYVTDFTFFHGTGDDRPGLGLITMHFNLPNDKEAFNLLMILLSELVRIYGEPVHSDVISLNNALNTEKVANLFTHEKTRGIVTWEHGNISIKVVALPSQSSTGAQYFLSIAPKGLQPPQ